MKLHTGVDARRLLQMLGDALLKETESWKQQVYNKSSDNAVEISGELRDGTVEWLVQLNRRFQFHPETLALSAGLLDRFLHAVKARPKYLKCIGVACFYVAAKITMEDELVPGTLEFMQRSHCGCSVSEVCRMERVVLDKLHWDIRTVTPLEFLHIFHALVLCNHPSLLDKRVMTPSRQLAILTAKLQHCLTSHRLLAFAPSTQALAILTLELESFRKDWLPITFALQAITQIGSDTLIHCRELTAEQLASFYPPTKSMYVYNPRAAMVPIPGNAKPTKRKVEQIEESDDDDDIYDGIKRLYNEEASNNQNTTAGVAVPMVVSTTCATEARQDPSAVHPLQPTAAN